MIEKRCLGKWVYDCNPIPLLCNYCIQSYCGSSHECSWYRLLLYYEETKSERKNDAKEIWPHRLVTISLQLLDQLLELLHPVSITPFAVRKHVLFVEQKQKKKSWIFTTHFTSSELWSMFNVMLPHSKLEFIYIYIYTYNHVLGNADLVFFTNKTVTIMSCVCITHSNSRYRNVCLQSGPVQYH